MIVNVGYQFDRSKKEWLAAFMMASKGGAGGESHYELLTHDQIEAREAQARAAGDTQAELVYDTAEDAIEETVEGKRATPNDLPPDFDEKLYSVTDEGEKFKVIDPLRDVDWTEYFIAQKTAEVRAEKVEPGTVVETIMADGHVETSNTAGPDGGYRVTNPAGEQYLVDTAKFESLYEAADADGVYRPVPDARKVLHVEQNVAFKAPWGEEMKIREDGVLVNGGGKDVYGIQPDEYSQTYSPV